MDSEQEPFLSPNVEPKDARLATPHSANSRLRRLFPRAWVRPAAIHFGLVLLYTVVSLATLLSYGVRIPRLPCERSISYPLDLTKAADTAAIDGLNIKYSPYLFQNLSSSPYGGPPAPESDAAWDALLAPMHIRVSGAELQRDNQESVALTEGGGFLGWMGVFHELHCIVSLRCQ